MLDAHSYTEALAGVQEPAVGGIPYSESRYHTAASTLSLARFNYLISDGHVDRQAVLLGVCP